MYNLSDKQLDFILSDIKNRGVQMEDLQVNLLDHICCIIEEELKPEDDFYKFYNQLILRFFNKELKEIEDEAVLLLTNKNYYEMKKAMITSGSISVILLMTGSFFKLMHWPGAGIMLVLGVAFISLLFLPLLFLTKSSEITGSREKIIFGLGALVGILYCMSTLFKIMHWPGATQLWFTTIALSAFVFIPLYFFNGFRNPEKKVNTIITTILLVGATSILFMLMNTRPAKKELALKAYNYLRYEELLTDLKSKQNSQINSSEKDYKIVREINMECEQIKSMIIENSIGMKSIPSDFEQKGILVEDGRLGDNFYDEKKVGAQHISHLRKLVEEFNQTAAKKIPKNNSALDESMGNIGNYSTYAVLNSITQLQLFLLNI